MYIVAIEMNRKYVVIDIYKTEPWLKFAGDQVILLSSIKKKMTSDANSLPPWQKTKKR